MTNLSLDTKHLFFNNVIQFYDSVFSYLENGYNFYFTQL